MIASATKRVEESTNVHFTNQSTQPSKVNFHYEKVLETTTSWAFSESEETNFSNKLEVRVDAKASFFSLLSASGHVQNNFEWSKRTKFSQERFEKKFSSNTFNYVHEINIGPNTDVRLVTLYKKVDLEIPFEADIKFSAVSNRIRKDGIIISNQPVDANAVLSFLKYEGYKGNIYKTDGAFVYARATGRISVNNAHDLVFKLVEKEI